MTKNTVTDEGLECIVCNKSCSGHFGFDIGEGWVGLCYNCASWLGWDILWGR
jgi:hypothetical protein